MKRIWIAGNAGSGKTTLANYIGEKYNIPVYHRDLITWDKNGNIRTEEEQVEMLQAITKNETWIFEGARFTASKIDGRLDRCDTIIYLNINRVICVYRGLRRAHNQSKNINMPIEDKQPFGIENIKSTFIDYPKKGKQRKTILDIAKRKGINIIVLSNRKSVKRFCLNMIE